MDSSNPAAATPQQTTNGAIALTGDFLRPMVVSLDELRRHASVTAGPFDLHCYTTKRFIRTVDSYRGVRLTDLIEMAGLREDRPGDFKRTIFIALAHDGYAVTFSWHELFNTVVGELAIVACEMSGQPLGIDAGAPVLFSAADILPAPRHVTRLASIVARVVHL